MRAAASAWGGWLSRRRRASAVLLRKRPTPRHTPVWRGGAGRRSAWRRSAYVAGRHGRPGRTMSQPSSARTVPGRRRSGTPPSMTTRGTIEVRAAWSANCSVLLAAAPSRQNLQHLRLGAGQPVDPRQPGYLFGCGCDSRKGRLLPPRCGRQRQPLSQRPGFRQRRLDGHLPDRALAGGRTPNGSAVGHVSPTVRVLRRRPRQSAHIPSPPADLPVVPERLRGDLGAPCDPDVRTDPAVGRIVAAAGQQHSRPARHRVRPPDRLGQQPLIETVQVPATSAPTMATATCIARPSCRHRHLTCRCRRRAQHVR